MIKHLITGTLLLLVFTVSSAQEACMELLLVEKGRELSMRKHMEKQNSSGFYLFRNVIYDVQFNNREPQTLQLIDIDSTKLSWRDPFKPNNQEIEVAPKHIEKLILSSTINPSVFEEIELSNYTFTFSAGNQFCEMDIPEQAIYKNDTRLTRLLPYLTIEGIRYLYLENNDVYVFQGTLTPTNKIDSTFSKRFPVWFTPNKVEQIYGVAIGISSNNIKHKAHSQKDSLKIVGLNLELNAHEFLSLANSGGRGPLDNSYQYYLKKLKHQKDLNIVGINFSLLGLQKNAEVQGLSIGLVSTVIFEQKGFMLSGLNNYTYIQQGVTVAGLVNRCAKGKGIQLGAFNKSEHFKGIQIGLWNVIGDKGRPFINWNFK